MISGLMTISIFISILFAIYDHLSKLILKEINYKELYIIRGIFVGILVCLLVLFNMGPTKLKDTIIGLTPNTKIYIVVTSLMGVISILIHLWSFQKFKISNAVGVLGGLYIVSTLLMGRYVFNETLELFLSHNFLRLFF